MKARPAAAPEPNSPIQFGTLERCKCIGKLQFQVDVRIKRAEVGQARDQPSRSERGKDADPKPAIGGPASVEGLGQRLERVLHLAQQQLTSLGRDHPIAGAAEELPPNMVFKFANAVADSPVGEAQFFARSRITLQAGSRFEGTQSLN